MLNKLKDKIYQEQFLDEDENTEGEVTVFSNGAEKVLEALQKLRTNPILLDYVVKCLKTQGLFTTLPLYQITTHEVFIMPYDEEIHKTPEAHKKHCIDGDFGKIKTDSIVQHVFSSSSSAEDFAKKCNFAKHSFSINKIGQ